MKLAFDPEYIPDAAECGSLTTITKMPGYIALHKIMKSVVDAYLVQLRESNTTKPDECVENVRRSQISAEIYQQFVDRVNTFVHVYTTAEEAGQNPIDPDVTAALDMQTDVDDFVSYFDGLEEGQIL